MATIPYLSTPDKPLVSASQKLVPVADITDGIVIYRNGSAALIMESTSLNFGLLSEREQSAVIASYAGLLNSFNFPVQIVVRSEKKDISSYMRFLDKARGGVENEKLLAIMDDYRDFIMEAIKKRNVLSKRFFITIPFSPYELGLSKSFASNLPFRKEDKTLPYPKSYVARKAKISLLPKKDHLMRQATRIGIKLKQLTNEEVIKLIYEIYNPEPPVKEQEMFGNN